MSNFGYFILGGCFGLSLLAVFYAVFTLSIVCKIKNKLEERSNHEKETKRPDSCRNENHLQKA